MVAPEESWGLSDSILTEREEGEVDGTEVIVTEGSASTFRSSSFGSEVASVVAILKIALKVLICVLEVDLGLG